MTGRDPLAIEIDTSKPHPARMYDWFLGGKDNYPVDEQMARQLLKLDARGRDMARVNRAFMHRATRWLAERGVRQFLDIGTGLPTADNTHEIAQHTAPHARVVYVDNDPIVLAHARVLLSGSLEGATEYVDADVHDPERILKAARHTLDLGRPVAVMMLGILNFVLDTEEARSIVRTLMAAVPSGSHLALTHPTLELGGEGNEAAMRFWNENATPPITARSRAEFASFLDGLELLEPGIVPCSRWRTNPREPEVAQFGAVGRKP
ncbi:SAM-dependent methyltransferase [Streptomyces cavourensis]|nr:SAM-dependent methyltransferase [Streptomyces cavourensis]